MKVQLPLETERLVLREFVHGDLAAVHCYASDPEVVRYMSWGPNTEQDTRDAVRRWLEQRAEKARRNFTLAIVLRDGGQLIGACSIRVSDPEGGSAHIGYCLNREYWGRGYATEAARALVKFGFEQLGLHRIFAKCDTQNLASARVLENAGMLREGHLRQDRMLRGEWRDSYLYAVLEQE
jgi:ribosomal-protein-alanine N-acetyltransferase